MELQLDIFTAHKKINYNQDFNPLPITEFDSSTVGQAQSYLLDKINKKGANCPCCGQFSKIYSRSLYSTQVAILKKSLEVVGVTEEFWHISSIALKLGPIILRAIGGGDWAKLENWGFIEEKINTETNKRCSGYWRILPEADRFINRGAMVPKGVLLYNGKRIGFTEEKIRFRDIIREDFDYQKLMKSVHD